MEPISLAELVQYTWRHSNFYQRFWGDRGFNPERDFQEDGDFGKIPILTKDDLLSVPAKARSVFHQKDGHYFADISSGTTQSPLIVLKSHHVVPPYYKFIENLSRDRRSSCLILRPGSGISAFFGAGLAGQYFPLGSILTIGDINNFSYSARLALEIEVDWLLGSLSDILRFASFLEHEGYSPSRITALYISGEPLTSGAISFLRQLYPNALTLFAYGITEGPAALGSKSSLCTALDAMGSSAYHVDTHDFIFEIVNGVSVVTALHVMPTPLIRYNTGDRLILKEDFLCSCGFPKSTIGIVGPRVSEDSYKIGGCAFRVEAIQNALRKLPDFVTDDFKLQIEQVMKEGRLLNLLRFVIRPVGNPTPFLSDTIRKTLEREIYVAPRLPLGERVRQGTTGIEIDYDAGLEGGRILPPREIAKHFQTGGH